MTGRRVTTHPEETPMPDLRTDNAEEASVSDLACIFCRNHDMADECWHSPEYEPVARAFAVAFCGTDAPSDEQVGWYVDDAENIGSDLWHYLGRETPLTCRDLGFLSRDVDTHAVLFNDHLVVTVGAVEKDGESMTAVVADLTGGTR